MIILVLLDIAFKKIQSKCHHSELQNHFMSMLDNLTVLEKKTNLYISTGQGHLPTVTELDFYVIDTKRSYQRCYEIVSRPVNVVVQLAPREGVS